MDHNDSGMERSSSPQNRSRVPTSVSIARALFLLNAVIWVLLAAATLLRSANGLAWGLALLMLANAGVMLWAGRGIGRRQKRFYYLALAVLAVNIVLTVTDQFGALDLSTLVIDVLLFALLIVTRGEYSS